MTAVMIAAPVAATDKFNVHYEVEPVTFSDGTVGELYVASKQSKNNGSTTCSYRTLDFGYLGQYQSLTFAASEQDTLVGFCLDHYAERAA